MSVQMNQYLAYGYLLPYKEGDKLIKEKLNHDEDKIEALFDKYDDSAFDKEVKEVNGCTLISDGMNGRYHFFGKVFKKSEVYEPLETSVFPKVTAKIKKQVAEELISVFGETMGVEPGVVLLTHYC